MKNEGLFDVTIIGGGPAGLFASFYSGLREMKTKVIEYQPRLGGKVHVYPEKMIWDVGGLTPVLGETLIEQLIQQGLTFDPTVVLNQKVERIGRDESGVFVLHAASGERHYTKTIILAIGGGILEPQRIELEGAGKFDVANLSYTVKSFINHGYERDRSLLENSEVKLELADGFFVAGQSTSVTSVPGIYAAGDIIKYEGKVHLIAGAFQDAANAVNQAKLYIQPEAHECGMVSSHNDIFQSRNRELIKQLMK